MGKVSAAAVGAARLDNVTGAVEQLKGSIETLAITVGMPHTMRIAPTGVVVGGGWRVTAAGATVVTTSITYSPSTSTPTIVEVVIGVASGLAAGDGAILQANNDAAAYIAVTGTEL